MSRLVIRRTSGLITAKVSLNVLERMAKCVPMFGEQVSQLVKAASDIVSTVEVSPCLLNIGPIFAPDANFTETPIKPGCER